MQLFSFNLFSFVFINHNHFIFKCNGQLLSHLAVLFFHIFLCLALMLKFSKPFHILRVFFILRLHNYFELVYLILQPNSMIFNLLNLNHISFNSLPFFIFNSGDGFFVIFFFLSHFLFEFDQLLIISISRLAFIFFQNFLFSFQH